VVVPVLRACVHSMHACMTWADMTGDASRIQYQQGLASGHTSVPAVWAVSACVLLLSWSRAD
jgi:hypothetical protein